MPIGRFQRNVLTFVWGMRGLSPRNTKIEAEIGYLCGSGRRKQLEIQLLASALRGLSLRKLVYNLK